MASTVWRGYISFGLISIPVRLYRAARAERVRFRRVLRENPADGETEDAAEEEPVPRPAAPALRRAQAAAADAEPGPVSRAPVFSPVQQASVRQGTGDVLPAASVVKGYEYEKNRYVAVDPEELKSVAPKTSTTMEIEEFVQLAEIDPVY